MHHFMGTGFGDENKDTRGLMRRDSIFWLLSREELFDTTSHAIYGFDGILKMTDTDLGSVD